MKKIYEVAQLFAIDEDLKKDVAIDFTCGNGGDLSFLSQHFNTVFGYDIQKIAIDKCLSLGLSNVIVKHKSHELFDEDVQAYDVGMFNLGYLPGGDKTIYTEAEVVQRTISKALQCLNTPGRLIITCYPGFDNGYNEAVSIEKFLSNLASKHYDVTKFNLINRHKAPYILVVDKH